MHAAEDDKRLIEKLSRLLQFYSNFSRWYGEIKEHSIDMFNAVV